MWAKTRGYCYYCGDSLNPWTNFAIDHIRSLARGGTNALPNLAPVCRACNSRKGDKHPEEFRLVLAKLQKGVQWSSRMRLLKAAEIAESYPARSFKFYFEIVGEYDQ